MFPALLANKKKTIIIGVSSLVLIIAVVIVIVCCVKSKNEEAYRTRAEIEKDIEEIRAKETALIDELYEIAVAQEKMAKEAEATPVDYEIEVAKKDMAKKAEVPPVEAQMVDATPVDDKVTVTVNKIEDATVSNVKTVDNKFNTASLLPETKTKVQTQSQETKTYKLTGALPITEYEKGLGSRNYKTLSQKTLIDEVNRINIAANEKVAEVTAKGWKSDATKYRSYTNNSKLTESEYKHAKELEKKAGNLIIIYADTLNEQYALKNVLRNQSQSLKSTDARYKLLRTCADGLDKDILITDDGKLGQNIHDKAKIMSSMKTSSERMSKFEKSSDLNAEATNIAKKFDNIKSNFANMVFKFTANDFNRMVNYIDKGYLGHEDYKAAKNINIPNTYVKDLIDVKLDAKALIKVIENKIRSEQKKSKGVLGKISRQNETNLRSIIKRLESLKY